MKSKTPFKIECREEGRGKPSVVTFQTLAQASDYIQNRWNGSDYIDCADTYHTDYCTYTLLGFTLNDIGHFVIHSDGWQTFEFNPNPQGKARIVGARDSEGDTHHFRASEDWINTAREAGRLEMGPWTDKEYAKQFGAPFVSEMPHDHVQLSVKEEHATHLQPVTWCPLCAQEQHDHDSWAAEQTPL